MFLILLLSKKIRITFVKKPVRAKWRKHDTRGSMAPFSHLLWLAYGLYMTTATLLNGHLYTECFFNCSHFTYTSSNISSHNCISLFLPRNICPKILSALNLSTAAHIHPIYRLLLILWKQTLILKKQLKS